jgi:hypothetical protein
LIVASGAKVVAIADALQRQIDAKSLVTGVQRPVRIEVLSLV